MLPLYFGRWNHVCAPVFAVRQIGWPRAGEIQEFIALTSHLIEAGAGAMRLSLVSYGASYD